jgi:hypothetical protein
MDGFLCCRCLHGAGKFLVRDLPRGLKDQYLLSVVHQGQPVHYHLFRQTLGGRGDGEESATARPFVLNGVVTSATSLNEAIDLLREQQSYWPSPLTADVFSPRAVRECLLFGFFALRAVTPRLRML